MALELVVTEDAGLTFTLTSGGPPDIVAPAGEVTIDGVKITTTYSNNVKASAKKVSINGITGGYGIGGAPPPGDCPFTSASSTLQTGYFSISPTATKVKADALLVMRETDADQCTGSWKLDASPFTVYPCVCDVEVTTAGQTKAFAE